MQLVHQRLFPLIERSVASAQQAAQRQRSAVPLLRVPCSARCARLLRVSERAGVFSTRRRGIHRP